MNNYFSGNARILQTCHTCSQLFHNMIVGNFNPSPFIKCYLNLSIALNKWCEFFLSFFCHAMFKLLMHVERFFNYGSSYQLVLYSFLRCCQWARAAKNCYLFFLIILPYVRRLAVESTYAAIGPSGSALNILQHWINRKVMTDFYIASFSWNWLKIRAW